MEVSLWEERLSPEMVQLIWAFLPPREVFLLSSVCASWRDALLDPTLPWRILHERFANFHHRCDNLLTFVLGGLVGGLMLALLGRKR